MRQIIVKAKEYRFLLISITLYLVVVGTISVLRHYQFQTQAWDMGIFEQTMWNTLNGRVMQNSLEEIPNHLGVHMSPFLFLLIPFYAFFQSPYFLLIIQTLALGLAALPLYFFVKNILSSEKWAKVIVLSYLLNPALHSLNLSDWHEIAFFVPFVFAAFYFFEQKNLFWVWIFMFLAASTKEDAALISISIVLFWLTRAIFKIENKKIKFKMNKEVKKISKLFIFLLLYFVISVQFIMPAFGGGLLRLDRYGHLGEGFLDMAKNIITNPGIFFSTVFTVAKMKYVLFLFWPVIFLPLMSVASIFLVLPGILENILTNYDTQFSGLYQYDAIILPGMYISAVFGLGYLEARFNQEKITSYLLIIFSFTAFLGFSMLAPGKFPIDLFTKKPQTKVFSEIVKIIPKDASVAAPTNLVPHLAHREYVRMLGNEEFFTNIVIIDRYDKFGFGSDEQFQAYFDARVASGQYKMTIIDERYIILNRL